MFKKFYRNIVEKIYYHLNFFKLIISKNNSLIKLKMIVS